jgi:hypothetical protein
MKFNKINIIQISQKQRKKLVKRTIKDIKHKIKWLAKKGDQSYYIDFYENYTNDEQEIIGDYFIKRGFEVNWIGDDSVMIR